MRKTKLSASIMCANLMSLGADIRTLESGGIDYFHLDVMDGHFVPEIGLGIFFLEQVTRFTSVPVDVHLMVTDPGPYVDTLARAGASLITLHVEVDGDVKGILENIRDHGLKTGLALRPDTPLASLLPFLDGLDLVLLMAYPPGIRNQKPGKGFEERIGELDTLLEAQGRGSADIAVDGGVSAERMTRYRDRGASFFILGTSGLFIPQTRLTDQVDNLKMALHQ